MSAPQKAPKSNLKILVGVLVVAAGFAALSYLPKGEAPGAPAGTAEPGRPRAIRAGTDPESVPDLARVAAQDGEKRDTVERNIFRFQDSPTPTPRPTPVPAPTPILPGSPFYIGPMPIQPTPTPTPIVPPAIPYKALGVFGPRDALIVSLEEGGRIINAREGDTVDVRFIILKINRESVDFAFTGLPPEITRRLPIPLP